MIKKIKSIINRILVKYNHPELQSGKIIRIEDAKKVANAYSQNGSFDDPISFLGKKGIGYSGANKNLTEIFNGVELGTWAIDSQTIDWIWDYLSTHKPNTILEFGSGSSTCLFCAWMKKYNPKGLIISIEQNPEEAKNTSKKLYSHNIAEYGHVLSMDVDSQGQIILDQEKIKSILNDRKFDLVFIDGPAGPNGCRENTLPSSIPLLSSSASWFLHDSYRIGELEILNKWSKLKGISAIGIVALGNGLGIGTWESPN